MRLLSCNDAGDFSLTTFEDREIPPYAILSHTWGPYDEEVSMKDLFDGTAKAKAGYKKLRFCEKQATQDGLHYFWIDTCCIDKSSSAELTEAINSMFAWYRNAARCYVYLNDVTALSPARRDWSHAFRQSRWFTRGWTLQELLAPASVEFFSAKGQQLGDEISPIQESQSNMMMSVGALMRQSLADFIVEARMSLVKGRNTKRRENTAYLVSDMFSVDMTTIYTNRELTLARLRCEEEWNLRYASLSRRIHEGKYTHHFAGHIASPISNTSRVSALPYADSDEGSDIGSFFPDGGASISSALSAGLNLVQMIGIREVSRVLLSIEDLKAVYIITIVNFERRKARSHIRGFLNDYGQGLLRDASSSSLATQIAKFVCESAGLIADEIIWNITEFNTVPYSLEFDFEKRVLETWLSGSQGGGIGVEEPSSSVTREVGDDMFEESEFDEELHDDLPFPHINKVNDFLLNSQAFQQHITAMRAWLMIDGGGDREHGSEPIENTANPVDIVEMTEDTIDGLAFSTESQQQNGVNCNTPVEIESDRGQETAHEHEPNPQSRHRRNSARGLVSGLLDFWGISFFFYDIVELFVPRVPQGYRRLRWRCSCNTVLWGDFPVEDDAAFEQLKQELLGLEDPPTQDPPTQQAASGGASRTHAIVGSAAGDPDSVSDQQTSATSPPVGLGKTSPANPGTGNSPRAVGAVPSRSDHVVDIVFRPKYFEVCVSKGNYAIDHHEIDISRMTSDSELFELIWDKYNLSRGSGLRRLFLRPSDVNFVLFSVNRRNQYGAGIHKKPDEYPPQTELDSKRYHYLCPQIRMPANVFLHYLHRARWAIWGEHTETTWLNRLPKKLNTSLLMETLQSGQRNQGGEPMDQDLAFGWGIHIIDGPNHGALGLVLAVGVAITFVVSGMVVGFAKTQEQGFGVGNFLLAILASAMVAVYFQLQDQ